MNMQNFPGQHALISSRLKDIIDEIDTNQSLMLRLRSHADSMALVLKSITFPEHFLNYFSYVNSVLCKYMSVMSDNNCKLQTVLNEELLKRNFSYNEYENFVSYRSKPLPLNPHNELYSFEYTNNLSEQSQVQEFGYLPAVTNVQSSENVEYTIGGNYGFITSVSQNGETDQVREYYTQYVNNDMLTVQDISYLPIANANGDHQASTQEIAIAELNDYQGNEVLRQENASSFICYSQNNQVRVVPIRSQVIINGIEGQQIKQEKQYYEGVKEEGQYYVEVTEEDQQQYYEEEKEERDCGEIKKDEEEEGYDEQKEQEDYENRKEEQNYEEEKEEKDYDGERQEQDYEEDTEERDYGEGKEKQGYEEEKEEQDYGKRGEDDDEGEEEQEEEEEEGEEEEEEEEDDYEQQEDDQGYGKGKEKLFEKSNEQLNRGYGKGKEKFFEKSNEQLNVSKIRCDRNESVKNVDVEALRNDSASPEIGCTPINESQQRKTKLALPNKHYTAQVTHAVSPSEIYVRFVQEKCPLLQKLQKELEALKTDEKYKKPFFFPNPKSKKFNKFRLKKLGNYALFCSEEENKYFRVQLMNTDVDVADNLVSVFLLDTGMEKRVKLENIFPMPAKLKKYPRFAFKCHLTEVTSKESENSVHWSSYDIEFMKEWISKNDKVVFAIDEQARENEKTLPILLYDSNKAHCLNDIMREIQANKNDENEKLYKFILENWDPMLEAHKSNMNTYDLNTDDPSCAIYGYVSKDHERLCKHYRTTGKCFKGLNCRKEHGLLRNSGYPTDKEEIFVDAFKSIRIPRVGEELKVEVTHVANGSQFHCMEYVNPNTRKETLSSLVNFMNDKENLLKMRKISIPPSVGQIVIAKYTGDDSWYRAKVVDTVPENDEYTVFFVDYGNEETLPLSRLRMIEPEFLHFPFQSMFCEIEGVMPSPDMLKESMEYLDEVSSSVVKIKVVSVLPGFTPHLIVRLYTGKGEDVGEIMLEKKLAIPNEHLILNQNEIIPG